MHISWRVDLQTDRGLHHHQLVPGRDPGARHHPDRAYQARLQAAEGHQQGGRGGRGWEGIENRAKVSVSSLS